MKTFEPESEWLIGYGLGCTPATERGVYVDLGCSHPVNKSLTAFLRDFGWTGLAVDGNPDYQQDWINAGFSHHFAHAILSDQPRARFAIHDNAFTSRISSDVADDRPEIWGINRIVEDATTPLNALLELHNIERIDLLNIDLEGQEFAVLSTLDFNRHSPAFIISEFVTACEGIDCRGCNFLLSKGYEVIHMTDSNLIFKRNNL